MSKRAKITVLTVVLVVCLLGCRKGKQEPTDGNATTAQQIRQEADEALQAATDYMAQQRDKLVEAAKVRLDTLERQFEGWLEEAGIEDEQARQKLSELGANFKSALGAARGALEEAQAVGTDAWEEAKPAMTAAVKKAQQAYDEFVSYIRAQAVQREQTPAGEAGPRIEE